MEAIIGIVFMLVFQIIGFLPFIIIAVVVVKGIKSGKFKVQDPKYMNMNRNMDSRRNEKSRPVLQPGENFRVEKINAPTYNQNEHNHAYVHKVEPIDEISIMKDTNSTMSMLNEKRLEQAEENRIDDMRSDYLDRNAAKNADIYSNMTYGEQKVICKYCGAENIVARGEKKTCYFCRQEL